MKLSVELGKWRADRPDEWKMDEFIRNAAKLETERDALAVQVEALKQSLISARARGNLLHNITMQILQGAELNGSDWDYISESQVAEIEQNIAKIRDEAILRFAGHVLAKYRHDVTNLASQYADSIRQCEVR